VPALVERLPELLDEVRLALEEDWPDYAHFLAANRAEVGVAADAALNRLVTLVTSSSTDGGVESELFEQIGRIQWRQGNDLTTLLSACDYYASRKKQRIYFEYILIGGVNDSEEQAHLLAGHARRISARINLIPYNSVEGLEWTRPSRERQERFLAILRQHGVVATLRREKGHDIAAACGQLRLQTKRAEEKAPI